MCIEKFNKESFWKGAGINEHKSYLVPDSCVFADCIPDEHFNELTINMQFLSFESFSRLINIISKRCPELKELVIQLNSISPIKAKPAKRRILMEPQDRGSVLLHLALKMSPIVCSLVRTYIFSPLFSTFIFFLSKLFISYRFPLNTITNWFVFRPIKGQEYGSSCRVPVPKFERRPFRRVLSSFNSARNWLSSYKIWCRFFWEESSFSSNYTNDDSSKSSDNGYSDDEDSTEYNC